MSFFSRLTIDGIIADITSKIESLHAVAELHAAEANAKGELELQAGRARAFAESECARAKVLAAKFEALVKV